MARWIILCPDCSPDPDETNGVFEAKDGYQGEAEDGCILSSPEYSAHYARDPEYDKYFCDDCGMPVAIHKSSRWFINNHREEREREFEEG